MSQMTTKILEESLGKIVLVRLKGGKKLRGKLKGFDQHLNLLLEETEDVTNAEKAKNLAPSYCGEIMLLSLVLHLGKNKWEKRTTYPHIFKVK